MVEYSGNESIIVHYSSLPRPLEAGSSSPLAPWEQLVQGPGSQSGALHHLQSGEWVFTTHFN